MFQTFNLVPLQTARQNVVLPLMLVGRRRHVVTLTQPWTASAWRSGDVTVPVRCLGGQQQRVAIARALVIRPEVLFADQPTGALDSRSSRPVMGLLRGLVD